ncbi:DNA phosphorothioation system sulfurtransferase DndC [Thermoactinomyces daqus]|uniref:DNA phosphorothioation system sulfurtransferase DndC n=2 Tax=Thermoactinomyces daqus TaxID=1329516 RepID=A0A7W1X8J1_9BACL|nr:DNA phosphorothioation system sulfurtransferase DndC [Thermoactinomyces daqus]
MISIFSTNEKIERAKEIIKEVYLADNRPWVVGFSGGKDSSAVVQLTLNALGELEPEQRQKKVYVISSDTLVETPLIINQIDKALAKIQAEANRREIPVETQKVKPEINDTFWVSILGKGYPTPRQKFRWCTDRMKIKPANRFIQEKVSEHGEVVMVLGVRMDESKSRAESIKSHTIEGTHLMKHSTLPNAYTFAPIKDWTTDDVWEFLLDEPVWGEENRNLLQLYQDSDGECPLVIDADSKKVSCGNSRFGCWTCTVVNEDKALSGFINNGVDWLRPLLEYRNYLVKAREDRRMRQKCRTNGRIYLTENMKGLDMEKAVVIQESELNEYLTKNNIDLKTVEDLNLIVEVPVEGELLPKKKTLGLGPFTIKARKQLFHQLMETQEEIRKYYGVDIELISPEEIEEIERLWAKEGA